MSQQGMLRPMADSGQAGSGSSPSSLGMNPPSSPAHPWEPFAWASSSQYGGTACRLKRLQAAAMHGRPDPGPSVKPLPSQQWLSKPSHRPYQQAWLMLVSSVLGEYVGGMPSLSDDQAQR